jgi:hypothetical protein
MTHQPLPAVGGARVGMCDEKVSHLGFQQLERPTLARPSRKTSVSFSDSNIAAITPPYPFMLSPTFANSSRLVQSTRRLPKRSAIVLDLPTLRILLESIAAARGHS